MRKIYLKEELNPEYYKIGEERNQLMDRWNVLNNEIRSFTIPRFLFYTVKEELKRLKNQGEELSTDYIAWNNKATNFLLNPNFQFEPDQKDRELVYINFTNSIRFLINTMQDNMVLIAENFNKRSSQYRGQRNFNIAIAAFILGFSGFMITVYSTFFTPKVNTEIINKTIPKQIEKLDNGLKLNSNKIDSLISSDKNVIQELKSIQRVQRLCLDSSSINILINKDIHSAQDIIKY